MATNKVSDGNRVTVVAPSGGYTKGKVVVITSLVGVALETSVSGANCELDIAGGIWDITKLSGVSTSFAVGANVFWDATNAQATVSATSNTLIGVATTAAANADTTVRTLVKPGGVV
jgi:predicted RecA/RadA family phage recombinase